MFCTFVTEVYFRRSYQFCTFSWTLRCVANGTELSSGVIIAFRIVLGHTTVAADAGVEWILPVENSVYFLENCGLMHGFIKRFVKICKTFLPFLTSLTRCIWSRGRRTNGVNIRFLFFCFPQKTWNINIAHVDLIHVRIKFHLLFLILYTVTRFIVFAFT